MNKVNFIALGLALLMTFGIFAGCSVKKYNAVIYSKTNEWIQTSFRESNKVKGAYYKNPDYVEGSDDINERYYRDETSPKNRTFIVDNQEEFDKIFVKNIDELKVDFSKRMIVAYTFNSVYYRNNKLVKLVLEDDKLTITYEMEKRPGVDDASQPSQVWFVVILDKFDVNSVVFVEKK